MSTVTLPETLTSEGLDLLFREARTYSSWLDRPVSDRILRELYDAMKWGPTSANSNPARIVFVRSAAGKERLLPAIAPGNLEKVRSAPVTAIVAYDLRFFEKMPQLFPHAPQMGSYFEADAALAEETAKRSSTLQGAYLLLAARALGLDGGPLSGFDNERLDREFFANSSIRSNFLLNLGYGDRATLHPRLPRLAFDEAVTLL